MSAGVRVRASGRKQLPLGSKVFLALSLLVGVGLGAGVGPWLLLRAHRSMSWEEVDAIVTEATLESRSSGRPRKTGWRVDVTYRYERGGVTYTGDRASLTGQKVHPSRAAAEAAAPKVGAAVKAYVDPADPSASTLYRGSSWPGYLALGIGAGFVLVGLLVARPRAD